MNRKIAAALAASAGAVLIPLTVAQVTSASPGQRPQQDHPGAITIESWLYAVPSENVLSGTVWDCFKITGAITDQGGGPAWANDTAYKAPNTMTQRRGDGRQPRVHRQGPRRRFHLRAPACARPVRLRPVHLEPGLARRLDHRVRRPHHRRPEGRHLHHLLGDFTNMTTSPITVKTASGSPVCVQPLTTGPDCTWVVTGGTGAYTDWPGTARVSPTPRTRSRTSTTPSKVRCGGPGSQRHER